jgi:GDSL-like Lipase/Acylhydrolase family
MSSRLRAQAKKLYRAIVGPAVDDQVRLWPGTVADGGTSLRYLHIGDCNFRRMDFAHDIAAPPGYPLEAADHLLRRGIGVEFSHCFAINYEHLPTRDALVKRARRSGPIDVISVHIGGNYTRWIVIPDTVRTMQLRVEIGRRLRGRGYRAMHLLLGALGRPAARYHGAERYDHFLGMLQGIWPEAQIIVLTPLPRLRPHRRQRPIGVRVTADIRTVAARRGLPVVDTAALLGTDARYRGASGYHLNRLGGEVVGRELTRQILESTVHRPPSTGNRPVDCRPWTVDLKRVSA